MLMRNLCTCLLLSAAVLTGGCASNEKPEEQIATAKSEKLPDKIPFPYQGELHQDNILAGHFWSVRKEKFVPWQEIFDNLPEGGWLLLGEAHDMEDHQGLEALFIQFLAHGGKLGNVGFEQLDEDQQELIDPWLKKGNQLNGHFINWNPKAWNWNAYINPLSSALNSAERVIAINPSRARIQKVYQGEYQVEFADQEHTQLMSTLIQEGHCNMLPMEAVEPMVRVQLAKDQFMAERLSEAALEGRVGVAVMGYQHARKDYGVPLWLNRTTNSLTILLQHLSESKDPQSYIQHQYGQALPADYILFTPSNPRGDYCKQLKEMKFSHQTK